MPDGARLIFKVSRLAIPIRSFIEKANVLYVSNLWVTVNKAGFIGQYIGRYVQYIHSNSILIKFSQPSLEFADNYLAPIFYRMYFAGKCEIASAIKTV